MESQHCNSPFDHFSKALKERLFYDQKCKINHCYQCVYKYYLTNQERKKQCINSNPSIYKYLDQNIELFCECIFEKGEIENFLKLIYPQQESQLKLFFTKLPYRQMKQIEIKFKIHKQLQQQQSRICKQEPKEQSVKNKNKCKSIELDKGKKLSIHFQEMKLSQLESKQKQDQQFKPLKTIQLNLNIEYHACIFICFKCRCIVNVLNSFIVIFQRKTMYQAQYCCLMCLPIIGKSQLSPDIIKIIFLAATQKLIKQIQEVKKEQRRRLQKHLFGDISTKAKASIKKI